MSDKVDEKTFERMMALTEGKIRATTSWRQHVDDSKGYFFALPEKQVVNVIISPWAETSGLPGPKEAQSATIAALVATARRRFRSGNVPILEADARKPAVCIQHKFGMIYSFYLPNDGGCFVTHRDGKAAELKVLRWFGPDKHDDADGRRSPYNEYLDELQSRWYNAIGMVGRLTDTIEIYSIINRKMNKK